ncbi:hypothetical protein Tco_0739400 [Tanacetum coccineum]
MPSLNHENGSFQVFRDILVIAHHTSLECADRSIAIAKKDATISKSLVPYMGNVNVVFLDCFWCIYGDLMQVTEKPSRKNSSIRFNVLSFEHLVHEIAFSLRLYIISSLMEMDIDALGLDTSNNRATLAQDWVLKFNSSIETCFVYLHEDSELEKKNQKRAWAHILLDRLSMYTVVLLRGWTVWIFDMTVPHKLGHETLFRNALLPVAEAGFGSFVSRIKWRTRDHVFEFRATL